MEITVDLIKNMSDAELANMLYNKIDEGELYFADKGCELSYCAGNLSRLLSRRHYCKKFVYLYIILARDYLNTIKKYAIEAGEVGYEIPDLILDELLKRYAKGEIPIVYR